MALFGPKTRRQPGDADSQPVLGPGAQLTQARERWGMSREQVAETLRLPQRVIAALEQDHYQDLPPPAFVRGYISGYARLVGLDASSLVAACEMNGCGDPALAAKRSLSLRKGGGESLLRWGSYAALAAFLGSAMLYWAGSEEDIAMQPIAALGAQPGVAAASMTGDEEIDHPRAELAKAAVHPTAGTTSIGSETNPAPVSKQPFPLASTDATVLTASAPAPAWPTLELRFSADSWLAVRDADGNRLAWETVKAGSTRQLQGAPPLKVVLGNADAVRISFQGEPFDPTPFTIGRMARFSVE